MSQRVKNQLAMQETHVESLGQEDPLEEEMVTHSRIIAREELSWWSSGKESAFNVGDAGSMPDQRTKIPHAVGLSKNKQTNKPWILKIPQKDESFITCICTQVFCRLFYELSLHASYLSCEVLL